MRPRHAVLAALLLAACSPAPAALAAGDPATKAANLGVVDAYAPPMKLGPWYLVASHVNSVTFRIHAEQIGNVPTLVTGEVRYWGPGNRPVVRPITGGTTTVTTGNSIGSVWVRFKGTPFGTFVRVTTLP